VSSLTAMAPAARYAKAGDVNIAYVSVGDGPVDLVWVPTWISQCEHLFEEPTIAAAFDRLSEFCRLILFDRRGSGLSDPMSRTPTLEEQMDDVLAVMEATGSEQAAIAGLAEGGSAAALFAATHPDRTTALILYASFARTTWAENYAWTWTQERREEAMEQAVEHWGTGGIASGVAPIRFERDEQFREWGARLERLAASPTTIRRIMEVIGETDIRDVLPSIRVPTLVMHRRDDTFIRIEHSHYLSEHIPGSKYVELEGSENLFSIGDFEAWLGEVEEFLTGQRHEREPDRMLATVLFTDICDSTKTAAEMGDSSWRQLLAQHDTLIRRALERHRGEEVKQTGDGFLATFDGPARAIRCAASIAEGVRSLGLEVRTGLHTGECEMMNGDLGGLAVHIAARVMASAGPGEVVVSSTVKDLVVGSGIDFEEQGVHDLKGVPGQWQLFKVS
jgi:class 3 adenylate cyclase